ncbi:MAG: Elongation factor [Dehalococcoidia bacterium]|nr:Elongation factor [Dehalococcoidia bacterium]
MQVYRTEAIRNIVLLSHSGAGTTSLSEALLMTAGAITRLGQIADGNTVSDYEPEEIDRRGSIQMAVVPCEWKGKKLNFIDTPGYADFVGEVLSAISAADLGMIVVSAVDGVQVGTESTWHYAGRAGLPRMIVVSKLDRENANFYEVVDRIQRAFGRQCVPVQLPKGSPAKEVVDLLDEAASAQHPRFAEFRERLVEAVAEADTTLTEKYLEHGDLSKDELVRGLRTGILNGAIVPILAASAIQAVGAKELMDFVSAYGPSPTERPPVKGSVPGGGTIEVKPIDGAPLAVRVFKTAADPYVGKLSYLRVAGATLKSDSQVWNANEGEAERIAQLFVPRGKVQDGVPSLAPGDIGAVGKLQHTSTGDTLCVKEKPIVLQHIEFPPPVYSVSLSPKTKADMDKMGAAVARMVEEDPSLRVRRDQDTGETVLSGMGDAHIDVATKRLKRKFGVDILIGTPAIPYRETITSKTNVEYKHKKQSGGHGQYGHVLLEMEPLPRGSGIQFATRVVGGTVPKEYVPAVEKGVMEGVQQGIVTGNKVVDVRVTLYDGSSHPVDSSGMAFQIAAVQAVKKGLQQGRPILLEPVMHVRVTVPDQFTGDIMGDLNSKRAHVSGTIPESGVTVIEAHVPLSEMQRYATELRSLTQGRGNYTMQFSNYQEVPQHLAQKIADEAAKAKQA